MISVGIDPGMLNLGAAVVSDTQCAVKKFTVAKSDISGVMGDCERSELLSVELSYWLDATCKQSMLEDDIVVAIEGPAFRQATLQKGIVYRAIYDAIRSVFSTIVVLVVPPTVLKKFITGKGTASKERMMECVIKKYFETPPDFGSHDLYDAYALAKYGSAYFAGQVSADKVESFTLEMGVRLK